jgi:hypothetical protein
MSCSSFHFDGLRSDSIDVQTAIDQGFWQISRRKSWHRRGDRWLLYHPAEHPTICYVFESDKTQLVTAWPVGSITSHQAAVMLWWRLHKLSSNTDVSSAVKLAKLRALLPQCKQHGKDFAVWPKKRVITLFARSGEYDCLRYLLMLGCPPNSLDKGGNTPLHHCTFQFHNLPGPSSAAAVLYLRCMDLLLQFGADRTLQNNHGETGLQLIEQASSATSHDVSNMRGCCTVCSLSGWLCCKFCGGSGERPHFSDGRQRIEGEGPGECPFCAGVGGCLCKACTPDTYVEALGAAVRSWELSLPPHQRGATSIHRFERLLMALKRRTERTPRQRTQPFTTAASSPDGRHLNSTCLV